MEYPINKMKLYYATHKIQMRITQATQRGAFKTYFLAFRFRCRLILEIKFLLNSFEI